MILLGELLILPKISKRCVLTLDMVEFRALEGDYLQMEGWPSGLRRLS